MGSVGVVDDYREELNEIATLWGRVIPYLDEQELSILKAVVENNGITLYRLSRVTGLAFSTVFKKTRKLSSKGIITISKNGKCNSYSATILGLIICLAKSCLDKEYIAFKLLRIMSDSGISNINELLKILKVAGSSASTKDVANIRSPSDLLYMVLRSTANVDKSIINLIRYQLMYS
ncbi:winged helix-turn-helix transcriptional regulator [Caldivirga sp. UBA161]|uniref:winged helix-turn-helix transcriptional regulator n=1 Tax=Caldivirga sp. UBA161 TaxID=1915569 RepID=UPI0025B8B4F1|nr:winged helix-turn-helix transcriptional regulator [Caldivirga sp. UBA161]